MFRPPCTSRFSADPPPSNPVPKQLRLLQDGTATGEFLCRHTSVTARLLVLCAVFLLQGCATRYGSVVRHFREAPECCGSLSGLPVEPLQAGDRKGFSLGAGSPAFRFDSGKSYFRAFSLPQGPYPYTITLSSYLVGDFMKTAYLFYPRIITLDEYHRVVRSTGPDAFRVVPAGFFEDAQGGAGFRYKIEGGMSFTERDRNERYAIILTDTGLLEGKTPVPAGEVPMLLPGSPGNGPGKPDEVLVPHAPGGRLKLIVSGPETSAKASPEATMRHVTGDAPVAVFPESPSLTDASSGSGSHAPNAGQNDDVAVRLADGSLLGRLQLGRTDESAARRFFEGAATGLGPALTNSTAFRVGSQSFTPERVYSPPGTFCKLYFDARGTLMIFVDGTGKDVPSSANEFRRLFPAVRETWHSLGAYELQADIGDCVTLVAVFRAIGDSLDSAAWVYVCAGR